MGDYGSAAEMRMIFGNAVRCRRQELGLSQRAMARQNGLAQRLWCSIETGSINMTIHTMCRVAAAVDGDVPQMLTAPIE